MQIEGRQLAPIIALTPHTMAHQVGEYEAAGLDAHVAKPIEVARLFEVSAGSAKRSVLSVFCAGFQALAP